ncbi:MULTISPECIES: glycosyltransferase family 2 protein [Acinetobacter]|uniref:glycosyltransferase family 2 protein n=1 Tax=Acinetobacter TaxID=469 RepID=UPI001436B72D|nr:MULTISPECIES: glycosyltransferase [Acinetobacter]MCA4798689.1 glycosyltransferase [Acinetobacter towneri]MCA4814521.1 glycosyltransferase [Acinetobacter towneri]QIV93124.1 glycosyltransferase [Acinetobacter towneri]HHW52727.1 glycosyltransferase [Acinetobacter towneri]
MQPLVSIVIPCYNHDCFIEDTIQSVIDQTYERIELIIIDDGSIDLSVAKIKAMLPICQKRFESVYFTTRPNKGVCATLNEALTHCHGKYVSFIASDDLMLPQKTFIQVKYLENHADITGVFGGIFLINDQGEVVGERVSQITEYTFEDVIKSKHDLPALTQMYLLSVLKDIDGFDPNIKIEDWDLLLRLLQKKYKIAYIPEKLAKYRVHNTNFSNNSLRMAIEMQKVLEKFKHEPYYSYVNYRLNRTILRERFKKRNPIKYYIMKIINKMNYIRSTI